MRYPPALQPGPWQPAENEKSDAARERGEIDQQQRRSSVGIGDQTVAPWQARDDDDRERDQADCAVDEDGIGGRAPAGAAARDQPEPHRVAADRGRQRLVEKRSDQIEAHRLPVSERRAAFRADLAPAQHAEEDLQERHGDRQADPAQALRHRMREARSDRLTLRSAKYSSAAEISILMVENRIRRISSALVRFEEVKTAQIGAARRISPPWYGFRADLAIAGQVGIATPIAAGKEVLGNWLGGSAGVTMRVNFIRKR